SGVFTCRANKPIDIIMNTLTTLRVFLLMVYVGGNAHIITKAISGRDMWQAAKDGDLALVKAALASGTHVDWRKTKFWYGKTALHAAAGANNLDIVRELLGAGANEDKRDVGGRTPLWEASLYGCMDAITILIDHGADVHIRDNDGSTLLHATAYGDRMETARMLMNRGLDARQKDIEGNTPGNIARIQEYYELASFLDTFTPTISPIESASPGHIHTPQEPATDTTTYYKLYLLMGGAMFMAARTFLKYFRMI
ncbi:unnamed protein product, partial [Meganyctiphanes norvegica]